MARGDGHVAAAEGRVGDELVKDLQGAGGFAVRAEGGREGIRGRQESEKR